MTAVASRWLIEGPLLLLILLAGAGRARAQVEEDACHRSPACRRNYQQATEAYQKGRYEEALQAFGAAYAIQPVPLLLVNIGRTHFKLGHFAAALSHYRRYLTLVPQPPDDVRRRLDDYVGQARSGAEAVAPASPAAPPGAASDPAAVQRSGAQAPPPRRPEGTDLRELTFATPRPAARGDRPAWRIGVGAGAVAISLLLGGFGVSALSKHGHCIGELCLTEFDTLGIGSGLLAGGLLLAAGGITLIAIPGPRGPDR